MGVTFKRRSPVSRIERVGETWHVKTKNNLAFEAPIVVNCSGAWGSKVADMMGEKLPISAEAPTMMVTAPIEPFLKPVVIGTNRKLSFKQAPNGTLLIGGGYRSQLDLETRKTRVDFDRLKVSARTVLEFFPQLRNVPIVRTWAGIEGLTPDRLPIISKGAEEGIYHSFGYSSHGYMLAPVTGKIVKELIHNEKPSFCIDAFDATRFESNAVQAMK
ncbi:FAD-binding oxidoreductase, partial [Aliiglaciecola sp.]|nr:FAD-binding oxidoreductase [Aliiglaciecola sp.]